MPVESTSPVEFGKLKQLASLNQTFQSLPIPSCQKLNLFSGKSIPPTSQRSVSFTKLESSLLNHESGVLESGACSRGAPKRIQLH